MNTHRSSASRESVGPAAVAPIDTTSVRKQSWLLLILLAAAQFMVIIDATVVNVALPSIGSWFGWQWVSFINVPIGTVAAVIGLSMVPSPPASTGRLRDLDIVGALFLIAGLVMLVLTITAGTAHGWGSVQMLIALVVSVGLLAGFGLTERKARQPIVPPSTWRVRSLVAGNAIYLGASAVMGGAFFLSTLYIQGSLGLPAWQAGLAFLPLAVAVGVGGKAASELVAHAGSKVALVLGLVIEGGGALLLACVPADATYLVDVLPGLVAIGFGLGFSFVAAPLIVMSRVSSEDSGMVSGLMQTAHEIGISIGVAALSAIATGATLSGGLASGYREGMLVAAVIAGVLALGTLTAVPAIWPAGATGRRMLGAGLRIHGASSSSQDPA